MSFESKLKERSKHPGEKSAVISVEFQGNSTEWNFSEIPVINLVNILAEFHCNLHHNFTEISV